MVVQVPDQGPPGEERDMYYSILNAIEGLVIQAEKAVEDGLSVVKANDAVKEESVRFTESLIQVGGWGWGGVWG